MSNAENSCMALGLTVLYGIRNTSRVCWYLFVNMVERISNLPVFLSSSTISRSTSNSLLSFLPGANSSRSSANSTGGLSAARWVRCLERQRPAARAREGHLQAFTKRDAGGRKTGRVRVGDVVGQRSMRLLEHGQRLFEHSICLVSAYGVQSAAPVFIAAIASARLFSLFAAA
jgi:hypothetical protein